MFIKKNIIYLFWIFYCLIHINNASAQGFEWNIMTGGAQGTYIKIGKDIASLAKRKYGRELKVNTSKGSIQNMEDVRRRPHTQFGIVQSDVLSFMRSLRSTDAAIRDMIKNARIVFPLYNEEIHILAKKNINSLQDLNGARVGVGGKGSGTNLTATFVLNTAKLSPAERLHLSAVDSLKELRAGNIDAFFYVAGVPASLFKNLKDSEGFKLLQIEDPKLLAYYNGVTIPQDAYPWLKGDVKSIAVKAILMTYDYQAGRNEYHRQSCKAVSDITYIVNKHLGEMQADSVTYHPKWKQVELSEIPAGWKHSICVRKGLRTNYKIGKWISKSCRQVTAECKKETNAVQRRLCLMQVSGCG